MLVLDLPEPDCGSGRVRFKVIRRDLGSTTASAIGGGVQAGWPLWRAEYQLDRMDPRSGDQWGAFLDRLRGRQRLFLGGDTARPFPAAYRNGFGGMVRAGGGAFDGSALTWAQAIDGDGDARITLTGLPAGLELRTRDAIGFKWDAAGEAAGSYRRAAMVRLAEDATADGAGSVTALVEPPLHGIVPVAAVAHLDRPRCMLRLVPRESDLSGVGTGSAYEGGTIVAMQELHA